MENKSQATLYLGAILVIGGMLVFLDINGVLPRQMLSIWSNLIIGGILLVAYLRKRYTWQLITGTFFIMNGSMMVLDRFVHINGFVRVLGVLAGVLLVGYFKSKKVSCLIFGALFMSWALYFYGISADIINGFIVGAGMWALAQTLGFSIVYLFERAKWAKAIAVITGLVGIAIVLLGLDGAEKYVLINIFTLASILIGLMMIIKYLFQSRDNRGK